MQGTSGGLIVNNGVACFLTDIGVYGGSAGGVGDLYVWGTAAGMATEISISGALVNGILNLTNCTSVVANGIFGGGYVLNGTVSNCYVNGTKIA
jgi:hypothetical protein